MSSSSLKNVVKLANKLVDETYNVVSPAELASAASKVLFKRPSQKIYTAVLNSLWPVKISEDLRWYEHNAYHLAANKHFLAEGVEIPLWDGSWEDTAVRCVGTKQIEPVKGKQRYMIWLKCYTGIPAGLTIMIRYTANALEYILAKYLHLSKLNLEAPEISGMLFNCLVYEDAGGLKLDGITVTPFMQKKNKELCEKRDDPRKCKTGTRPCYLCSKTIVDCSLAVRR